MAPGHGDDLEIKSYQGGRVMYGLSGSLVQFGSNRAKKKPGRKSDYSKFLEKQRDLFPVDLYTAKLTASFTKQINKLGTAATVADAPPQAALSASLAAVNPDSVYTRVHARTRALGKPIRDLLSEMRESCG